MDLKHEKAPQQNETRGKHHSTSRVENHRCKLKQEKTWKVDCITSMDPIDDMSCPTLNPTTATRFRDIVCYSRFDQYAAGVIVPSQFGSIDTGLQRGRVETRPVCHVVSSVGGDP